MLKASSIPPAEIPELRDLTRLQAVRVEHAVKVGNELRQALEKAPIKLDSVVSNLLGLSGRATMGEETEYARALYQRIARHRVKGRTIRAGANSLIQAIRHILTRRAAYNEPGIFRRSSAVHAPTACK